MNKNTLPNVPILLQEEIKKDGDIRVTVVGNKVFSAFLNHEGYEVDWRKTNNNSKWIKYKLPKDIEKNCIRLCKELKLEFGAIDLIKSIEGNYIFLELNPNGQWVWIEEKTGLPISNGIVNHLSRG